MSILSNIFKKKLQTTGPSQVLLINPGSKYIYDALGITKERLDELANHGDECLKTSMHPNGVGLQIEVLLEKLSTICVHPNELALLCFVVGRSVGKIDALSEFTNGLNKMFKP